jgi:hypothetical protein
MSRGILDLHNGCRIASSVQQLRAGACVRVEGARVMGLKAVQSCRDAFASVSEDGWKLMRGEVASSERACPSCTGTFPSPCWFAFEAGRSKQAGPEHSNVKVTKVTASLLIIAFWSWRLFHHIHFIQSTCLLCHHCLNHHRDMCHVIQAAIHDLSFDMFPCTVTAPTPVTSVGSFI